MPTQDDCKILCFLQTIIDRRIKAVRQSFMSNWYLIHTKVRQERVALENLQRQGFDCFLPMINVERLRRSALQIVQEPLFPRYLFVQLSTDINAPSWTPIRSTLGVSRLVKFGQTPAKIDKELIEEIRSRVDSAEVQLRHFELNEPVVITQGPFVGVEALFQMKNGDERVVVLFNMLDKQVKMNISPADIRKI
jgi:transcriptional antiterminator RfaH